MTPEAKAKFVALFAGPQPPPGKDRWHHLQYIPVQFPDGVEFIRDPFDAQMKQVFAEAIEELFGPEPVEEVDLPSERPRGPRGRRYSADAGETMRWRSFLRNASCLTRALIRSFGQLTADFALGRLGQPWL
jgi:hypothetical protein